MENEHICPNCGSKLRAERKNYPSFSYICDNCGWEAVTTKWDPIDLDETEYVFRLSEGNPIDKATLSLVSKLTGKNFIASKKAIQELNVIFKGKARDAVEMRDFLDKSGIHYSIDPELPY